MHNNNPNNPFPPPLERLLDKFEAIDFNDTLSPQERDRAKLEAAQNWLGNPEIALEALKSLEGAIAVVETRLADLKARRDSIQESRTLIKTALLRWMQQRQIGKLRLPTATLAVGQRDRVVPTVAAAELPDKYRRETVAPNISALRADLAPDFPWARVEMGDAYLTVRVKKI